MKLHTLRALRAAFASIQTAPYRAMAIHIIDLGLGLKLPIHERYACFKDTTPNE
jgi:hypothetical protein